MHSSVCVLNVCATQANYIKISNLNKLKTKVIGLTIGSIQSKYVWCLFKSSLLTLANQENVSEAVEKFQLPEREKEYTRGILEKKENTADNLEQKLS